MKKIISIMLFLSIFSFANDEILGKWYNAQNPKDYTAIVEIKKNKAGKYYGIIIELKEPKYLEGENKGMDKLDLNNKKEKLRTRKLIGMPIFSGFVYNEKDLDYKNGAIYNPEDGETYYSYMKLQEDGNLFIRGSIDYYGWFGKTRIWSRVK